MKTWKDFSNNTGTATTAWTYDSQRGWLATKRDANNQGCDYFYSLAGRLLGRLWARGSPRIATTNTYNTAGEMSAVTYSDGTPGVTFTYDRRGRQISCIRNGITTTRFFSDSGLLLGEAYSGGTLGGMAITNLYDSLLRRTNVTAKNGTTVLSVAGYGYDNASRMATVSDGTYSSTYAYVDNSPLVGQIDFKQSGTTRMRTTKEYDYLNRLSSITSTSASPTLSFTYEYNSGNQRIKTTLADGSYWIYTYDSLGQVITGNRYWADNTPVAGQQNQYNFDDIGNRTLTKAGGDSNGTNLLSASYAANSLNQYTSRTVPGGMDVLGSANSNAKVTVNGSSAHRKGEYFHLPLTLTNASAAVWQSISVSGARGGNTNTITGNAFLPQTPESFTHDLDGNQTVDGRWNYTWDGENRLISAVANTAVGPQQRIEFEYDCQSRRIGKKVWNNTAGTGSPATTLRFIWDGWNYIAAVDGNNALVQSYLWGLDLSGSLQGAGGVGGYIAVRPSGGPGHFPIFDGNGNVAGLVDGSTGILSARYEYGPFGEQTTMTGPMALANPCRWSGKYTDDETGLVYYGYRYYCSSSGRWLSKDLKEESGGLNLFDFTANCPNGAIDPIGLDDYWLANGSLNPPGDPDFVWTFTAQYTENKCEVVFSGKISPVLKSKEATEWYNQNKELWAAAFGSKLGRWRLKPASPEYCCSCPTGVRVRFNVTFLESGPADPPTIQIKFDTFGGRSNASFWHLRGFSKEDFRDAPYNAAVHELGHLFGLYDEYPDREYPNRTIPTDYLSSIMGLGTTVYQRHIERIAIENAKVNDHLPCPMYSVEKIEK